MENETVDNLMYALEKNDNKLLGLRIHFITTDGGMVIYIKREIECETHCVVLEMKESKDVFDFLCLAPLITQQRRLFYLRIEGSVYMNKIYPLLDETATTEQHRVAIATQKILEMPTGVLDIYLNGCVTKEVFNLITTVASIPKYELRIYTYSEKEADWEPFLKSVADYILRTYLKKVYAFHYGTFEKQRVFVNLVRLCTNTPFEQRKIPFGLHIKSAAKTNN